MKKVSILSLLIFTAFILISGAAISQETVSTDDSAAVKTEDTTTATTDHLTMEDTAAEHAEKVYEKEDVQLLKGQPKTFTDGYNTYVNDKVRFELFDMDNVMKDSVMYKIDDAGEQKYTEPFTLSDEGSHVIYYYSIDKMGNKEAMKSINVILDKTAPETLVTINAPFSKNGENIYAAETFTYNYIISSKDNISGVSAITYAVKGEEHKQYVKPFSLNSLAPVALEVTSEDRVGNLTKKYTTKIVDENGNTLSESIEDIKIIVDKTAPVVEIKADKAFYMKDKMNVASKDYKYTITAADTESGVKTIFYRIDNKSDFILYTGELQFNTNGMHKIEAIAKDAVGNTSRTTTLDVFVDIIPADTNIRLITE
jgi:predicted nucleic acid-binding OB-fold protein